MNEMRKNLDCIVIGAGPAGIAAGQVLHDAGVEFAVLEAGGEIGGRAKTQPLPDGGFFERGAMYLHGVRISTWDAAIRHRMTTHGGYNKNWFGGPSVTNNELGPGTDLMAYQSAVTTSLQLLLDTANAGRSLQHVLDESGIGADTKEVLLWEFSGIIQRDPHQVDATSAGEILLREAPHTGIFELVEGYSELWRRMSAPFADRVLLNNPVTLIRHSADGVEVTAGRSTRRAATAIVTPSVGVLQSGTITFSPSPTAAKTEAIEGLQMGTMIKIGALFKRAFWEDIPGWAARMGEARAFSVPDANYVDYWYLTYPAQAGTPLLVALLGAGSEQLTGDSGRIKAAVRADLEIAFGAATVEENLVDILAEDWAADPFVRGYASSVPVGKHHLRAALAAPTPPLFWAGEACATDGHAETVEAAISTGRTAAIEALHSIRPFLVGRPDSRLDWSAANE